MQTTARAISITDEAHDVKPRLVESIDFHGVTVEALPPNGDGKVWIPIRRVCEALGIANQPQQAKLATKEWACVMLIVTQIPGDDQTRTVACIDLDSLPMWLATIEASRVKPAVRALLVAFQRDCARVLRDHFFDMATLRKRPRAVSSVSIVAPPPRSPRAAANEETPATAFRNNCLHAYVNYEQPNALGERDTADDVNDLHMLGTMAEQIAGEVRRRWPEMVALLTAPRRLPRGRQMAIAAAGKVA